MCGGGGGGEGEREGARERESFMDDEIFYVVTGEKEEG